MARRPSVNYWASRGSWVDEQGKLRRGGYWTTVNGQQTMLAAGPDDAPKGPTYLKALAAFHDLLTLANAPHAGSGNTCRIVIEFYLRDLAQRAADKTLADRRACLTAFCQTDMADRPVHRLTPFMVQQWLTQMRSPRQVQVKAPTHKKARTQTHAWGDGKVWVAVTSLQAAFNFAVRQRLIPENPVRGLARPEARSRARDCIVAPADHERILARARGQLREFIVCLENAGCRPGELRKATAADWDGRLGAIIYHAKARQRPGEGSHKTAGKGKERRIFFRGEARRIIEDRVGRYSTGPLWRSTQKPDRPWRDHAMRSAFARLGDRLGLPKLSAYSYRHTFATRWLEGGGSIDDLAALMGSTAEMIRKHYAHLCDNLDRMAQLAEGFTAARTESPSAVLPFDQGGEQRARKA